MAHNRPVHSDACKRVALLLARVIGYVGRHVFMNKLLTVTVLLLWAAVCSAQSRQVQCEGNTIIKVGDRIGAQTPFSAIFKIEDDTVTMTEGDFFRFSTVYRANSELTRPGRPGYGSSNGNLFFFLDSGRFQIFKMDIAPGAGLRTETTDGQCKKFEPSNVFK